MTPVTANYLMTVIEDTINNFEPRADLISVKAVPDLDRNNYEVSIQFYIINIPSELIDLSIFLEVLR
jgi:predicted component of type VI protein secretion system